MKRLILVSAMILGLAATGAMASQANKNSKPAPKPAATSNTGGTMSKSGGKHHRRRHHRKGGKGASTGNMSATGKSKNSK